MQWFVSGEPAQVAVGVEGPWLVLARPLTRWGELRTELQLADRRQFSRVNLLWLPEVVAEAAEAIAARRRSFRWCRSCRRAHAPKWFVGAAGGTCRQCASVVDDVDA